jgi:WD40 repeat protein
MRQRKTKRGIERLVYSPSGRLLLGRDGQRNVQLWDAVTLEPAESIPANDPRTRLLDCLFRAGGRLFLQKQGYCSAENDLPTGAARPEQENALPTLEPQGAHVRWYWTATRRTTYTQHFASFGPDGQTFVGWHPGVQDAPIGLWRFNGELVRTFDWMGDWTVNDMALSTDGHFLAAPFFSGSAGYEVALVDLRAEPASQGVLYHTHDVLKVAWSPTAPLLACAATRSVWLWDAPAVIGTIAKGTAPGDPPLRIEPAHRFTGFRTTVEGLSFAPDGRLLVGGAREGRIRVWEVASGREKADLDWKSGKVNDVAFSPDGNTIAAACSKGFVVWDVD